MKTVKQLHLGLLTISIASASTYGMDSKISRDHQANGTSSRIGLSQAAIQAKEEQEALDAALAFSLMTEEPATDRNISINSEDADLEYALRISREQAEDFNHAPSVASEKRAFTNQRSQSGSHSTSAPSSSSTKTVEQVRPHANSMNDDDDLEYALALSREQTEPAHRASSGSVEQKADVNTISQVELQRKKALESTAFSDGIPLAERINQVHILDPNDLFDGEDSDDDLSISEEQDATEGSVSSAAPEQKGLVNSKEVSSTSSTTGSSLPVVGENTESTDVQNNVAEVETQEVEWRIPAGLPAKLGSIVKGFRDAHANKTPMKPVVVGGQTDEFRRNFAATIAKNSGLTLFTADAALDPKLNEQDAYNTLRRMFVGAYEGRRSLIVINSGLFASSAKDSQSLLKKKVALQKLIEEYSKKTSPHYVVVVLLKALNTYSFTAQYENGSADIIDFNPAV